MRAWQFYVKFADGLGVSDYLSPDVRLFDPGWGNEVFSRPIEYMEFYLPTGHKVVLSGMDKYNFFVEASENLGGGMPRIEAFWVCGKRPNSPIVEMWRIGDGKVVRQMATFGQEWGGTATRGWKQGEPGYWRSMLVEG